ncbi:lipase class 3 family protein [Striga hermonthica]|uniref:Lipase class 3 family protein n=1 Tax=Striga hermonthica TaxID=68872 RepID=A0A9N7NT91_STRHE|nr:lipase class 3 family protein [Striga hermonthica]
METLQRRVETWIRDQRTKILKVTWPPPWRLGVKWPWPPNGRREQQKRIQEELECHKKQLQELCYAVKAETLSDLQEILCCMVLSECVYKRPVAEMIRAVNKFKADFGGQVVSLERVQPSSDHVPHRYLLAEAGDTLFASFIGTKQYKDVMADANIFQGAIFHDSSMANVNESEQTEVSSQVDNGENVSRPIETNPKQDNSTPMPAVHRGFMARAKGIPALELYRLAQKKRRKLVLCGHSLGGAVAVLATLAILRVIAVTSKEAERVQVKCITFSQPPVGNAALRDYVKGKGWQNHFKTYCIPEDLVPRILSPAYFHHYNSQNPSVPTTVGMSPTVTQYKEANGKQNEERLKEKEGDQLVLGLGPVQSSFWRLSRLVPIEGFRRKFYNKGRTIDPIATSIVTDSASTSAIEDIVTAPQSLEIEEGSDGISLRPLPEKNEEISGGFKNEKVSGHCGASSGDKKTWRSIPSLPSYVPFGQLYLLGNLSVESLSGSEYSKLTSVRSVIAEVKERFQSHSMKSYRSRFQKIYELCMNDNAFSFLGREKELQFPQLQKWIGISVSGTVELGHIVDSPVIRAATTLVPLGWAGIPSDKNGEPLKVDISGIGLHLCTLIQARVNGKWCSTTLESFPSPPAYSELQPEMQKMRILVGAPFRRQPKHQISEDGLMPAFLSIDPSSVDLKLNQVKSPEMEDRKGIIPDGLGDFVVFCRTDFSTVVKEVHVRTRRVQLIGLEGAGKTSLLKAILSRGKSSGLEMLPMDTDLQEGIYGGLFYSDYAGVNLQNLNSEASRFRDELWKGIRDLSQKIDLVVLVHNLSHRIPRTAATSSQNPPPPALSLLLDEAKSLGIPNEEAALEELARDRILMELARERAAADRETTDKSNSLSAATIGASVGAGVGIILAVVMGAASALRKP